MKKFLLATAFMLICVITNGQEKDSQLKNEFKINALNLVFAKLDVGYERLLTEESSIGVDVFFSFDDEYDPTFGITPYYRMYFGNKPTAGFFAEAFGMYNIDYIDESDFAFGLAIGGKFLTKNNFVLEIYGGLGRNLFNDEAYQEVPRYGISFGKRF